MAIKDLHKAEKSIFAVALMLIVLVGVGVLLIVSNTTEDKNNPPIPSSDSRVVTGIVTDLIEDCVRAESLEDGEVNTRAGIQCDAGSFLTVDGITVQVATGLVPSELAFYQDISAIEVGDTVEIVYQENNFGSFDVNCDDCLVRPL